MKIINTNSHNPIHYLGKQSVIHSLFMKIQQIWNRMYDFFIHGNPSIHHKNEITITKFTPTKLTLEEIEKICEESIKETNEPLYEGNNEHIYEEIPAMKRLLFPDNEPIYDVPTSNRSVIKEEPIYKTPTNKPVVTRELSQLIADLESYLEDAKQSAFLENKEKIFLLRIFEGSELSI